ncbi:MAG: thioredoxin-dependent thiol peroxidase [Bacteroidales bacterium]|nr:thioredoxin-dependent thiol peroxidase [Bacteroidales bacterium]
MNIGDKAPDFLGLDEQGKEVNLKDYAGKRVILYFYPKDNTSGCTAEACSLRDHHDDLAAAGCEIIGVSVDGQASHQKFIEKHGLPFRLVADTDHKLVEAFGVWAEKSMYGRKYMGTLRTTFVIGPDGTVADIIGPKQIKTKTHGEQLLERLATTE